MEPQDKTSAAHMDDQDNQDTGTNATTDIFTHLTHRAIQNAGYIEPAPRFPSLSQLILNTQLLMIGLVLQAGFVETVLDAALSPLIQLWLRHELNTLSNGSFPEL